MGAPTVPRVASGRCRRGSGLHRLGLRSAPAWPAPDQCRRAATAAANAPPAGPPTPTADVPRPATQHPRTEGRRRSSRGCGDPRATHRLTNPASPAWRTPGARRPDPATTQRTVRAPVSRVTPLTRSCDGSTAATLRSPSRSRGSRKGPDALLKRRPNTSPVTAARRGCIRSRSRRVFDPVRTDLRDQRLQHRRTPRCELSRRECCIVGATASPHPHNCHDRQIHNGRGRIGREAQPRRRTAIHRPVAREPTRNGFGAPSIPRRGISPARPIGAGHGP